MLIELFRFGWVAKSEKRSKIGDFAPTRSVWYKISGRTGHPTNHLVLRLRRYKRISVENRRFCSNGAGWPKILGRSGRLHQPFFVSENLAKWCFIWYKNLDRFFFRFDTMHAFDRRTDGRTEFSSLDRVCIACSAVKTAVHTNVNGVTYFNNFGTPPYLWNDWS